MSETYNDIPAFVVIKASDFIKMELPARGYLLEPVIPTQGIALLFAPRGIGKTFAALSIGLAVAGGLSIYNWQAPTARQVLYVDGEMPALAMQERLSALASGMAAPVHALENLGLLTPDMQPRPMPDLSTFAGQQALEPFLSGVNLLILDNIATLCRSGKENESQSWQTMQSWLLDLRRRGMSVLLVHHAGKSGDQRGTSAREDVVDTVISLRRPQHYEMAEGARFEVLLTKARGIVGEAAKPFEVHLQTDENALQWDVRDIVDEEELRLKQLLAEGMSLRKCEKVMGISKTTLHRKKQRIEQYAS